MARLIMRGLLLGLAAAVIMAAADLIIQHGGHFGPRTLVFGQAAGGLTLLLGLGMALTGYWLAARGRAVTLRRRLVNAAVVCGAAGLTCSFATAGIWLLAGRPL